MRHCIWEKPEFWTFSVTIVVDQGIASEYWATHPRFGSGDRKVPWI